MNTHPGILGRKIGMTQLISDDGTVTPCSVIDADCVVAGKRSQEKDGYSALIIGAGTRKEKRTNKPLAGAYKKSGVSAQQFLREFRCSEEYAAKYELGQKLDLTELFEPGQHVDVAGVSRGRGFTGVMRRHNFGGACASHGAHEVKRHGGSIGTNMTPGKVYKGRKMAGQMGNKRVSVLNLKVAKVIPEKGLVLIRGGVPGAKEGMLEIRGAVKKAGGRKAS